MTQGTHTPAGGNTATPDDRAHLKWRRMDWLKWESIRARQRACQSRPVGSGAVELRRSTAAGVGFSGLQSCGSTLCPHCGAKIAAVRRDEVAQGVANWRAQGGTVLFGTLTLRHHRGQSLDLLASAVADCWEWTTKGRQWSRDKREHGIAGHVRVWETTLTAANGWHQHVHFLLFVNPGEHAHAEALLASMFGRWGRRAEHHGLRAPLLRAQDLHEVTGEASDVAEAMGSYLSKQPAAERPRPTPEALGWEVAGGAGKESRKGIVPLQLLDGAMAGDPVATGLWHEYELAMAGRRTIAWSRGIRDLLGLDDEITDQEIAEAEAGTADDCVVVIPLPTWRALVNAGGRGPLLVYASDVRHTAAQIVTWCRDRDWFVHVAVEVEAA